MKKNKKKLSLVVKSEAGKRGSVSAKPRKARLAGITGSGGGGG